MPNMLNIEMQNIEGAKYGEAKYRSGKISKAKCLKCQNIESPADLPMGELELRGIKTSCCLSQDEAIGI